MKIIYENDEGGVCIIHPAPKENVKFVNVSKGLDIKSDDSAFTISVKKARKAAIDKILRIFTVHPPIEGEWLNFIAEHDVPPGRAFEIVEDSYIPSDRTFRDSWKKVGSKVEVDMEKAKEIHMERIRAIRDRELVKSDPLVVREIENGGNLTNIRVERQKLRDIPQDIDLGSIRDVEGLKSMWPVGLPKE